MVQSKKKGGRRRRRLGGSLTFMVLWMSYSVDGFVSNHHPGTKPLRLLSASRIRGLSPLQSQTKDEIIQETQQNDEDSAPPSLPPLHQDVFQQDPEWYKEYVVGILGDDFCAEKWPVHTSKKAAVVSSPSTNVEPATSEGDPQSSEATIPNTASTKATKIVAEPPPAEKEPQISANTTTATSDNTTDSRTIVYRNIVGNTLTYVPLQNLTKLGYSIPELEKMQSDSLCVVVNDKIRNPVMGVPLQWCLEKNAPPQVQIMASLEEALTFIQEDESTRLEEKRQDREAREKAQKRKPTEDRQPTAVKDQEDGRRRSGPPRPDDRRAKQTSRSDARKDVLASKGSSWHNGAAEDRNGKDEKRLPDRRRRSLNRDGSPKPIYSGRDPYSNGMQRKKKDRGDPPVPKKFWMKYDTFKDLLRKEAEFRIRIAGEGFAQDIKRESDWRLQLYKNWLWTLHDGVGEGLAPPSRYERARKMQRRGGVYEADREERRGDRMRGPRERAEPKRKRSRGAGPPRPR